MAQENSGMKTLWFMLLGGLAVGLLLGIIIIYIPGEKPPDPIMPKQIIQPEQPEAKTKTAEEEPITFSQKVLTLLATSDALYLSRPDAGIFRTTNGQDWEPLRLGMEKPRDALTLVEVRPTQETLAAKLIEISQASGQTPDPEELKAALMELAKQKPGILAGMRDGRVMRLDEDQWKEISRLPADGGGVYALRYEPAVGLAACTGRGLHFSDNGGYTWTSVTTNSTTRDVLLGLDPNHRYLVAHLGAGLSACNAEGKCEKIAGSPDRIRCLAGDKALVKTFFGSDGDGLWLYKRGSKPEQIAASTLDTADIHAVARIGPRLFVAAGPSGLWMRKSESSGWYPGRNLPPDSITSVAVFKGNVYAGSLRYGLFSAPLDSAEFRHAF